MINGELFVKDIVGNRSNVAVEVIGKIVLSVSRCVRIMIVIIKLRQIMRVVRIIGLNVRLVCWKSVL